MTFPQPGLWNVPSNAWHFDYTPLQNPPGLRAVQVFALLSDVQPQGGGTVVLSGSHHLVARYVDRTKQEPKPRLVRSDLSARHPWLAELWNHHHAEHDRPGSRASRLLNDPTTVDGVELCVNEITGTPGDVYLMNSDCFHAIAPNARTIPRIMCTSLVLRTTVKG